jgi:xanthine dehydrogenase YagS FAD-binding subunit
MQGSRCSKASIVLGAAAPRPYRAKAAEAQLTNAEINESTARQAAQQAIAGATPLANNSYKIPIFEAIVRRTIMRAAGMNAEGVAA